MKNQNIFVNKLKKELSELVEAGVIDWKTRDKIKEYYKSQETDNSSRILLFFGIIGAILIGLGLILIIGHNWDRIPKVLKTILAFIPLIASQAACTYAKSSKPESKVWSEASAILLFFSIGAAIALISQIYHISGDHRSFVLSWMLLALPIIFLMPSSVVSFLVLIGITNLTRDFFSYDRSERLLSNLPIDQFLLYSAIVTYYLLLIKREPNSLFTGWHHYAIPIVGFIILISSISKFEVTTAIMLLALFSLNYNIGHTKEMESKSLRWNPYLVFGALGTAIILFILSYADLWEYLNNENVIKQFSNIKGSWPFYGLVLALVLTASSILRRKGFKSFNLTQITFAVFLIIFLAGIVHPMAGMVLTNIWLFAIGLYYIYRGNKAMRLVYLNFGMFVVIAVILARFFEMDLSFLVRGIMFVIVGLAFFGANYYLIKKSKSQDT